MATALPLSPFVINTSICSNSSLTASLVCQDCFLVFPSFLLLLITRLFLLHALMLHRCLCAFLLHFVFILTIYFFVHFKVFFQLDSSKKCLDRNLAVFYQILHLLVQSSSYCLIIVYIFRKRNFTQVYCISWWVALILNWFFHCSPKFLKVFIVFLMHAITFKMFYVLCFASTARSCNKVFWMRVLINVIVVVWLLFVTSDICVLAF